MSEDSETQRIIGQLQSSVSSLQAEVHALRDQVMKLVELAATAKGGWRTLISVAGVSTTIGAALAALFNRWTP